MSDAERRARRCRGRGCPRRARTRAEIAESRSRSAPTAVRRVAAVEGLDERALQLGHRVAERSGGRRRPAARGRRGAARAELAVDVDRLAGRELARRLAERVDRDLAAAREDGAPAVDPDGDPAEAGDRGRPGLEVQHERRVAVDAEDEGAVGQGRLQHPQAPLAHVAEAGVVGAALGVVVVGDDGGPQAGRPPRRSSPSSQRGSSPTL